MTRSEIPESWFESHAYAAVTLWRHGRPSDTERLLERVQVAGQHWHGPSQSGRAAYRWSVLAMTDAAEAVCRLIDPAKHPGGLALQFTDLDTGEGMEPGDFLYDVEGRAVVWASRVLVAAANGDQDAAAVLLGVLTSMPSTTDGVQAALVHLNRVAVGAASLIAIQVDADNWADLERTATGTQLPLYDWRCEEQCYAGDSDERHRTGNRDVRERAAAEHVLNYGHVVTRETRWT